jgi:predicted amidohydrolase
MRISLVQFSPKWEDKNSNMTKIRKMLRKHSDPGEVVIFPEMTLTGFTMNTTAMSEKLEGESFSFFSELAKKNCTNVFAGIIEQRWKNCLNTLIHCDADGKLKKKYHKIHPFSYSGEDKFYDKGEDIVVTKVDNWKIGLSICYDLRFPELFRLYAKKGVELIINIANWPDSRIEHWRTLLKARAIENQCYIAGVNRVGKDPKLNYNGYSSIFDPLGKEVVSKMDKELIISAEIEKSYVNEVRKKLPFLNDMRLI